MTVWQPEVTDCNFTAPIATLGLQVIVRKSYCTLIAPGLLAQVGFRKFPLTSSKMREATQSPVTCFIAPNNGNGTGPLFPDADTIPVGIVAGHPGDFEAEHDANVAECHFSVMWANPERSANPEPDTPRSSSMTITESATLPNLFNLRLACPFPVNRTLFSSGR